jgi:hypothetical protein
VFNERPHTFDVFVEYAKAGPDDILLKITAANRDLKAADLHLLPTLWFRNDWAAWIAPSQPCHRTARESGRSVSARRERGRRIRCSELLLSCEGDVPLLFTENETNHGCFPGHRRTKPVLSRTASTTAW